MRDKVGSIKPNPAVMASAFRVELFSISRRSCSMASWAARSSAIELPTALVTGSELVAAAGDATVESPGTAAAPLLGGVVVVAGVACAGGSASAARSDSGRLRQQARRNMAARQERSTTRLFMR